MSDDTRQTTKGAAGAAGKSRTSASKVSASPKSATKAQPAKAPAAAVKTAPAATKPAPEAAKPAETKAAVTKPAETKAAPAVTKPAETKPAPVAAKPAAKVEATAPTSKAPEEKAPAPKPAPTPIPSPAAIPLATPSPLAAVAALDAAESPLHTEAFSAVGIPALPTPEAVIAPIQKAMEAGAESARGAYASARETNEALGQACFESAAATSRGLVALNAQFLDLMRAHSDLSFSLMRSTLSAPSLSEAVRLQTSGARQAYETTATHLKAIAETTTRIVGEASKPLHEAMSRR
ncbi:phasin family protein [Salinarimonas sp.]|uniref:phasin family protein n=1 Tax=Salinarimonas sp. TaxID=2766526 RepID=UPI00391CF0E5